MPGHLVQRPGRDAHHTRTFGRSLRRKPFQPPLASRSEAVEVRHADDIEPAGTGQQLFGGIPFGIPDGELPDQGFHPLGGAGRAGIDPLPCRGVLPLGVVERKFPLGPRDAVAVHEHHRGIFLGLRRRSVHRLVDVHPHLIRQKIH